MKSEKQLQEYIKQCAKEKNMLCLKMASESRRGFPDLMLAYKSEIVFLELKSPSKTGRLSRLQINLHHLLRTHGVVVHVISNQTEADTVITRLINECTN
jgi:hypothetical protein